MADNVEKAAYATTLQPVSANEHNIDPTTESDETWSTILEVNNFGDLTAGQRNKINVFWGRADDEDAEPSAASLYILDKIANMTKEEALEILDNTIKGHSSDPNFPGQTMEKIKLLSKGPQGNDISYTDYDFELKAQAAIIHYHSPYPEVRSVTDPFDDPTIPVETIRAYFLGLCLMSGISAVNTFFSPRQPGIFISATVMQLLLAPCGQLLARVLPDRGFTVFGTRHSINPGPWSYKEQMFATSIFSSANSVGAVYYVYLAQQLPQYLGQKWVKFGYEILLALFTQFFGIGFAGILRRFVIYPATAIWPSLFPTLALNRVLTVPEQKGETVNGWKLTRYKFFLLSFGAMFLYFWVPNFLFTAIRSFNWMTWIAPNNFNLAMVTGFWGGMGFNPWATFDWNVSGTGALVTPFYSAVLQYMGGVLSGIIILAMYYGNVYWSAYMPINSNESFANDGYVYDVNKILVDGAKIDVEAYKAYGPPYFSGANVFGQGAWFAWYPMILFYVSIQHYESLTRTFKEMWQGLRYRTSIYDSNHDAHMRMMRNYKEVPDWCFGAILIISAVVGIVVVEVYPVNTPVWTIFAIAALSAIFLIPSALLKAHANVGMGFNVIFQLLAGAWFVGNPEALIIVTAIGQTFNVHADNYISVQKMAHYAKIPPRAIFRGQVIATFLNAFIFVGMLNWMVSNFDNGTLCEWNNPQHFVCNDAVLVFSSAIEYGAFGVKNLFVLYPILPWCFLIGAFVGVGWGVAQKFGWKVREGARRRLSAATFATWEKNLFNPLSVLVWFDPAVFWAGTLNWTGGSNLSYATNALYLSFIFMYYVKRNYFPWWQKYNYLLEAGFDIGVAISGILQTFALDFQSNSVSLNWWGNTVSTAGVDFNSYNQNATLLPIPKSGYFGLAPENFPLKF